jgi:hypothetical protein
MIVESQKLKKINPESENKIQQKLKNPDKKKLNLLEAGSRKTTLNLK